MWLQIKEHIAIKSFSLSERSSTNFIAEISVIRHPNEIAVLEKECVKIGDLSFNPDTGHARCGKYSHHFCNRYLKFFQLDILVFNYFFW